MVPTKGNVHSWWELVFKVVTGGSFGVYDLFVNNGTHNTDNLAAQQLTNQVKEHYKSDVLDDIHSNGVTEIRVSYYSQGSEAQYFVFDAVGATKTGWFSRDRLLNTSYDMTALADVKNKTGEFFSIRGDFSKGKVQRHFYINEGFYDCKDKGWVVVVDGKDGSCDMDKAHETTVHYVSTKSYSSMPGETADFMAIFVDRSRDTCNCGWESSTTSTPSNEYLLVNETEEIRKRIDIIKKKLIVPMNSTSKYQRSKTSAKDERMSSHAMGMVLGVGLISAFFALILLPDIYTLIRYALKRVCEKRA
ncbi:uncharacterized protein LOC128165945 [Crassostrea angulata]|uniref:uncharacterized protein LOC128165945 n=1 Tax=Magallana angulata TaxID=2784310 RepID=UPI0022B0FF89|nr:uncharacterized protein LOC128165945 [Crassostrea angulata]